MVSVSRISLAGILGRILPYSEMLHFSVLEWEWREWSFVGTTQWIWTTNTTGLEWNPHSSLTDHHWSLRDTVTKICLFSSLAGVNWCSSINFNGTIPIYTRWSDPPCSSRSVSIWLFSKRQKSGTWKWKIPAYLSWKLWSLGTTLARISSFRVRDAMAASSQQSPVNTPESISP